MFTLGIDTSNYATSLAVVNTRKEVVCEKKRILPVKKGQLGLRQSDAVFHHTTVVPLLLEEMYTEGVLKNITNVGVSVKPRPVQGSYMPCFLAGVTSATAFAAALDIPLVITSHQQGHLAAALQGTGSPELSHRDILVFHLSGGTTELLLCHGYRVLATVGQSLDLYAGQAVDRLGVLLGFSFPAGEALSALAATCHETIQSPKIAMDGVNCHLSGLQNQCEKLLRQGKSKAYTAKYCLTAIAKTMVEMAGRAREQYPGLPIICAGGVLSSTTIRTYIEEAVRDIYFVPPALSSDNAVGVALIATEVGKNGTHYCRIGTE